MNLRPSFQLRLRDESQFMLWRQMALSAGLSMNEWILRGVEAGNGAVQAEALRVRQDHLPDDGRGKAGHQGNSAAPAVPPAQTVQVRAGKAARRARPQDVRPACASCGGLNGLHQKGCKR